MAEYKDKRKIIGKALKMAGQFLEGAPSEEILLKEYEVCETENDESSRNFWTTFGIFTSFSTAVIGGVIVFGIKVQSINQIHPIWLGFLLIFGFMVFLVLCFLKSWLKRVTHLLGSNNRRMRQIEEQLGMQKNIRIWVLDHWENDICKNRSLKNKYENFMKEIVTTFDFVSLEDQKKILNCTKSIPKYYKPPKTGRVTISMLFKPLISIWGIFILFVLGLLIYRLSIG